MADGHGGNAETLHRYWVHGEGAAQIRWGTEGDFDRCTRLLVEHAHFSPEQAHGYCNLAHHAALGYYPATHAKMDHGRAGRVSTYTRSFPLEDISVRSAGGGRTVEAYAAVFDTPAAVDDQDGSYEEVVDRAAFNRTLEHATRSGKTWPVLFNHGMTLFGTPSERYSVPIGVSEEVRADGKGLFTRARFHKTQAADEVLEAIRDGSITAYSFRGAFLRSDPVVPRGGFRAGRDGRRAAVRRTECTLDEFGPGTFAVYKDAAIVGVRAEQAAALIGAMTPDERARLASMFRSGTPLANQAQDPLEPGTPDDSGSAAEDPLQLGQHSARSPKEAIRARRAQWIIRHGGSE